MTPRPRKKFFFGNFEKLFQIGLSTRLEHKKIRTSFSNIRTFIILNIFFLIRFFCPPPCVYLTGNNTWKTNQKNMFSSHNHKSFATDSGKHGSGVGGGGGQESNVCTFIGISNSEREMQPLLFDNKNFAAAKTMFISDSDKRKHFKLVLRAYYKNGVEIGSFFSNSIKVISKPSKKKQSVKNSDRKSGLFSRS